MTAIMPAYTRLPVRFSHGEGVWLTDEAGNRYLDALSGIGVTSLGHNHPAVTAAITEQASKVLHTSNGYEIPQQEQLAATLTKLAGMENVFFSNSGTEANEAAIKIARLYGHSLGKELPQIIVADGAFHGRSLATLSASSNRKIQAGFEPLVRGFIRAPFNDSDALRAIAQTNPNVVAILFEPVQGNGGIQVAGKAYMKAVRKLCDEQAWLLMLDEIQCGMGRSGAFFSYQHAGITPDVLTLAKALGNGVPIGACLAKGTAATQIQAGKHGSTFGGNPFCCHVAQTVVDTMVQNKLPENAARMGAYLLQQLQQHLGTHPRVSAIRGQGLLLGIELHKADAGLRQKGLEQGLLFNLTAGKVIRLLPPLIVTTDDCDAIVSRLLATLDA